MKKRAALITAPILALGLTVVAAMPAEAASQTIRKAKNSKHSFTGVILHGTDDKGGVASSVNAPAVNIEVGETVKKKKINGKNCAVWIPAKSKVTVLWTSPLPDVPTIPKFKSNKTSDGFDWVYAKGGNCTGGLFGTFTFRLERL